MTKVTIDRELLERELLSVLDFSDSNLRRVADHLIDAGYTRAAPRQPEGDNSGNPILRDGLEVVGYASECGLVVLRGLPKTGAVQIKASVNKVHDVPLCRLSDAQRAIAERDATIERLEAGIPRIQEQSYQMRQQRDKLAGLLREAAQIIDRLKGDPVAAGEMLGDIDAALAELKLCQESPHPAAT